MLFQQLLYSVFMKICHQFIEPVSIAGLQFVVIFKMLYSNFTIHKINQKDVIFIPKNSGHDFWGRLYLLNLLCFQRWWVNHYIDCCFDFIFVYRIQVLSPVMMCLISPILFFPPFFFFQNAKMFKLKLLVYLVYEV